MRSRTSSASSSQILIAAVVLFAISLWVLRISSEPQLVRDGSNNDHVDSQTSEHLKNQIQRLDKDLNNMRREVSKLHEEVSTLRSHSMDPRMKSEKSDSTSSNEIPFLYQVKDPRPLSEKTPLVPDDSLWLYPLEQRKTLHGDLKGPWYSQAGQDRLLYTGFYRNHFNGTFVELGAVDGVTYSNTKFFQDSMGWDGVLIEPSSDFQFLQNGIQRYQVGKPFKGKRCLPDGRAHCVNAAVCRSEGKITFVKGSGSNKEMVGGALDMVSESHASNFKLNLNNTYEVPCRPFGTILRDAGIKHIDFLSLDVEGAEETVLETMDWSIPIHIVIIESVEANSPTGPDGHERKHRILMENGFQFLMFNTFDEFWVNPKNSRVRVTEGRS